MPSLSYPRKHLAFILLCTSTVAVAQNSSLTLASGSAPQGSTASLNLVLAVAAGDAEAGLQWTLTYALGSIASISVTPGPALTAVGKTVYCAAASGSITCVGAGMDASSIGSGTVATATVTLGAAGSGSVVPISLIGAGGASPSGNGTIIAGTGGTITVLPPLNSIASLLCSPTTLASGSTSTCTVTLSAAAPSGNVTVALSSNNPALTLPASVTVPAGSTSINFSAVAGSLASNQTANVTASYNGSTGSATINLVAPVLVSSLTCAPSSLGSNATSTCTVTLTAAAPAGGAAVTLSSSNPALTVPASVTVAAAATTASFNATTGSLASNQTASATASYNGSTGSATINLVAPALAVSNVGCSPTKVASGANTGCSVMLSAAAPIGGAVVALAASNPALLTLPASVTVGVDSTTAVFTANAASVSTNRTVTITASFNGTSAKVNITIQRQTSRQLTSSADKTGEVLSETEVRDLSCLPRSVSAGGDVSCELRVTASAEPRPLGITSTSQGVRVPARVAARPNQTRLTFRASIDPMAEQQMAVITATSGGIQVQDTVAVVPAQGPVLRVASTQLVRLGEPLRFVAGASDPAGLPFQLSAEGLPGGATFDGATGQFEWVPNASQAGKFDVTFSAVNSIGQSSTARVSVEAGTGVPVLSEPQQLACSPNAIGSVSGKWLAASSNSLSEPAGRTAELGGTRVRVNGQFAPVVFSSTRKVSFLCPALPTGTQLSVVVETPWGTTTKPLAGSMQEATPTILSMGDAEREQGVVSFADSTELAMPRNAQVPAHPAQPGDTIRIWTTGLGLDAESRLAAFSATVGGIDVPVESIQAAPGCVGLYTVQVRAPMVFGDAVPVHIRVLTPGGLLAQSNTVFIAIEAGSD